MSVEVVVRCVRYVIDAPGRQVVDTNKRQRHAGRQAECQIDASMEPVLLDNANSADGFRLASVAEMPLALLAWRPRCRWVLGIPGRQYA